MKRWRSIQRGNHYKGNKPREERNPRDKVAYQRTSPRNMTRDALNNEDADLTITNTETHNV